MEPLAPMERTPSPRRVLVDTPSPVSPLSPRSTRSNRSSSPEVLEAEMESGLKNDEEREEDDAEPPKKKTGYKKSDIEELGEGPFRTYPSRSSRGYVMENAIDFYNRWQAGRGGVQQCTENNPPLTLHERAYLRQALQSTTLCVCGNFARLLLISEERVKDAVISLSEAEKVELLKLPPSITGTVTMAMSSYYKLKGITIFLPDLPVFEFRLVDGGQVIKAPLETVFFQGLL